MACVTRKYIFFKLINKYHNFNSTVLVEAVNNGRSNLRYSAAFYCSTELIKNEADGQTGVKRISKAMQEYLRRSEEYETFMQQQLKQFEKGKEFVAKIMGKDLKSFTQEELDKAIEYLFPSALHEKLARPLLRHPELLFKKRKEAQFDVTGRPFHYLFYTAKPNYSEALHECAAYLDSFNQRVRRMGPNVVHPSVPLNVMGTMWVKKERMEDILLEKLLDIEYDRFIDALNRLIENPYSYEAAAFIMKYRTSANKKAIDITLPVPKEIETGVFAVTTDKCRKKTCKAEVTVISPGTGKIKINHKEIDFFSDVNMRAQVWFLFSFSDARKLMQSYLGIGTQFASLATN